MNEAFNLSNEQLLSIADILPIQDLFKFSLTCCRISSLLIPLLYNRLLQDGSKYSPLQWAVLQGHAPLAELAILRGDDIEQRTILPNLFGVDGSPLFLAAQCNHPAVIRMLIKQGASTASTNTYSLPNALHVAAVCGSAEAIRVLLELAPKMACVTYGKDTPVHRAVYFGHFECVELLMDAGFDMHARGAEGRTILHAAVVAGFQMLEYLLGIGATDIIDVRDRNGLTPFHLAAMDIQRGQEMMGLLLRYGAAAR